MFVSRKDRLSYRPDITTEKIRNEYETHRLPGGFRFGFNECY
jgi:hypothetical protein